MYKARELPVIRSVRTAQ